MRLGLKDDQVTTITSIKHQRKQDLLNDLKHKFTYMKLGIHNNELPKFHEPGASNKWWKSSSTIENHDDDVSLYIEQPA